MLAAMAVGLWAAPPAVAADAAFRVNGVEFQVPLPTGYCLPAGADIDLAQTLAAGDDRNVTHLSLRACGARAEDGILDYILVKTPKSVLLATVTREQLLEGLGEVFENPEMTAALASPTFMENAEKSMTAESPVASGA